VLIFWCNKLHFFPNLSKILLWRFKVNCEEFVCPPKGTTRPTAAHRLRTTALEDKRGRLKEWWKEFKWFRKKEKRLVFSSHPSIFLFALIYFHAVWIAEKTKHAHLKERRKSLFSINTRIQKLSLLLLMVATFHRTLKSQNISFKPQTSLICRTVTLLQYFEKINDSVTWV